MGQEYKNIAVVGAGAAGCLCTYFLLQAGYQVTLFDKGLPLRTLLPTGGGRCNFAHEEYNPIELAKNYPRGEKFLYSIFSKFSTADTLKLFEELGLKYYIQDNGRIFPQSNSAKEVRETILKKINKTHFIKEEVIDIRPLNKEFIIKTTSSKYLFTHVICAIGGHSGHDLAKNLGIKITPTKPALVGLNTLETFKDLSGCVVKNCIYNNLKDDLLFTHYGISGPLIYTISSIKAFDKMPYILSFDLCSNLTDLQSDLNKYPHKEIKNILNKYLPQKVVSYILKNINENTKAHKIDGKTRDLILDKIHHFEINIIGTNKGEETVTAGGVDLKEINPKTMESKNIPNLYFIGEVLDIDGLCGGFNLQNAWSTAYVCAKALSN